MDDYLEQHKLLHNKKRIFDGRTLGRRHGHKQRLADVVLKHKPESILDYGSGKGLQYYKWFIQKLWGEYEQIPTLYDPCWEDAGDSVLGPNDIYYPVRVHSKKPTGVFDGVICTDVLEHVPLEAEVNLDIVLNDLFNYATKFLFITLSTRKAYKRLPNGQNAHSSVFPPEWWKEKIESFRGKKDIDVHVYAEGREVAPGVGDGGKMKFDEHGKKIRMKSGSSFIEKII